jgi:MoxR-like ATPase
METIPLSSETPQATVPAASANDSSAAGFFRQAKTRMENEIIGQEALVERLLIALLADGHLLVEGAPGLAKTRAVKALADCIEGDFQRLQFTPDLLPADLTGTEIYQRSSESFRFQPGPLFHNIVLADEINRAPAKVQSALLEAMSERQISIGRKTHLLPELFMVMATQNPIEQEGTYPLPEAQVDRFMFKIALDYPTPDEELQIIKKMAKSAPDLRVNNVFSGEDFSRLRGLLDKVFMDEKIERYILNIILATRTPGQFNLDLSAMVRFGASPRAGIYLAMASRARAILEGRGYVIPDDVKTVAMDILRHRLILTYRAEAEEISPEFLITTILNTIEVP